jgi:hypothetical protein
MNESTEKVENAETMEIMFNEACHGQDVVSQWSDAIDAKVLSVFGGSTALIGVIPALGGVSAKGWEWLPWIIAGGAWVVVSIFCCIGYRAREYLLSPDPNVILQEAWISLPPERYHYFRIRDMGRAWEANRTEIAAKAGALAWAIPFVALESGALLAALIVQR